MEGRPLDSSNVNVELSYLKRKKSRIAKSEVESTYNNILRNFAYTFLNSYLPLSLITDFDCIKLEVVLNPACDVTSGNLWFPAKYEGYFELPIKFRIVN